MLWGDVLQKWLKDEYPKYPNHYTNRFFYETSPFESYYSPYEERYITNTSLNKMRQSYDAFKQHINNSTDEYVTYFLNLSKKSMLIVPMPQSGKIFTTLKDFMDNASDTQQKRFWNMVAVQAIEMKEKHGKVWISTHGLGVPYLHVRIDTFPKYYTTRKFK